MNCPFKVDTVWLPHMSLHTCIHTYRPSSSVVPAPVIERILHFCPFVLHLLLGEPFPPPSIFFRISDSPAACLDASSLSPAPEKFRNVHQDWLVIHAMRDLRHTATAPTSAHKDASEIKMHQDPAMGWCRACSRGSGFLSGCHRRTTRSTLKKVIQNADMNLLRVGQPNELSWELPLSLSCQHDVPKSTSSPRSMRPQLRVRARVRYIQVVHDFRAKWRKSIFGGSHPEPDQPRRIAKESPLLHYRTCELHHSPRCFLRKPDSTMRIGSLQPMHSGTTCFRPNSQAETQQVQDPNAWVQSPQASRDELQSKPHNGPETHTQTTTTGFGSSMWLDYKAATLVPGGWASF